MKPTSFFEKGRPGLTGERKRFWESTARFQVVPAGRRSGKSVLAEGSYRWFAQYALDDGSNIRSLQKTAYGEFEVASITGQPSQIPT